ncbi:MAG: LysR substrate-binding domain-containing protein, partial [Flavobacteriaceae bacterium]|nr:LysR substrate-binding domain-containing protein [Flavobacteriaceae bacterium]
NQSLAYRGELFGQIKISVVSTGKYIMPFFLSDFLNQHRGVELSMDVTNKYKVVESLEKNQVDFALVSMMPDQLKLESIELLDNVLIWITSRELLNAKELSLEDLKLQNLIFREEGSATRKQMERYIAKHNFVSFKRMELTSNEAVKQSVIAGLGVSLVPLIGLRNHLERGSIRYISTPDTPIVTRWKLVWLKGKKFSPASEQFLKHLELERDRLIQKHFSWYMDFYHKINL